MDTGVILLIIGSIPLIIIGITFGITQLNKCLSYRPDWDAVYQRIQEVESNKADWLRQTYGMPKIEVVKLSRTGLHEGFLVTNWTDRQGYEHRILVKVDHVRCSPKGIIKWTTHWDDAYKYITGQPWKR